MDFSRIDLFSSLSNAELIEIERIAKRTHMSRGEVIFHEGDYEKNIYIIESGQIEIFKRSPVHGEQIIAVLKNGDYFGEMAFFEKSSNRSATARTLQTTVLIVIESNDFDRLLRSHPSISLKLLSTLSQRLRETTKQVIRGKNQTTSKRDCKVVTIASAKDGYGKSSMAATLAKMLSTELPKSVLLFDLDFYFGSGTQLAGVHSPRSIIDIVKKLNSSDDTFAIKEECIKQTENLWVCPAPRSFLEAESVKSTDILKVLKLSKDVFDYIIVDTGSNFNENFFTILDTSDIMFFLVNFSNISTITDNVRFFQGISALNYPKDRIVLLGSNIGPDFSSAKTGKVFPYTVIGGLPTIPGYSPQFGKPPYDTNPTGPYCEVIRLLARNVLKENSLQRLQGKSTFFTKLFSGSDPEQIISDQFEHLHETPGNVFTPIISSKDVRSQVKYIRYNLLFGYVKEAKENLLSFMEYSQTSAPLCELLGEIYLLEDLNSEALEAFQKAINLNPKQHLARAYLGILSGKPEMYKQGLEIVNVKIQENPSHLDLLNDMGKILMKNEDYTEALVKFSLALESNPNYLEAQINKTACLSKLNKSDEAIQILLSIANKNSRIFYTLGKILYDTGRLYLAYKAYSKALAIYGEYPGVRPRLTELKNYLKKLDAVIDLHERFVNTNPNFPDLHAKLGNFYHLAGKTEVAMEEYKQALKLNPNYAEAAAKLKALQKDIIWKLAKQHLVENEDDNTTVTKDLNVSIKFLIDNSKITKLPEDAVLKIRNIRTSKVMQKIITSSLVQQGFVETNCSPLGIIAAQDILLFQLITAKSKQILRSSPYYIEQSHITANHCKITLELEEQKTSTDLSAIGIKYFLVYLTSKHFSQIINADDSGYHAIVKNQNNGLEAIGHINPENNEQINFVLNGNKSQKADQVAVSANDKLSLMIEDKNHNEVFSTSFNVSTSDLENFNKNIITEEIS